MKIFLNSFLAVVVMACGVSEGDVPPTEAETAQGLGGGRRTDGYAAVGMVVTARGTVCTGSVVGLRSVLTSAVCGGEALEGFYLGRGAAVRLASDGLLPLEQVTAGMQRFGVMDQRPHPSWHPDHGGADLALLALDADVLDVTPLELADVDAAVPGRTCTVVGFGASNGWGGRKRSGEQQVAEVLHTLLRLESGELTVEDGDRGAPVLCGRRISGVTSGPAADGGAGPASFATQPQPHAFWIKQVMQEWEI